MCSEIAKELIDETTGIRPRKEMATRKLVDVHVQPFARDAPLEVDRKESIVASGDCVDRNVGPRFESTGLAEVDVGLGALLRFTLLDDL